MGVASKFEWPTPQVAAENESVIRQRAEAEVAKREAQYGFPSSVLASKLASGSVVETADVCSWLIALDALKSVRRGGPA